VYTTSACVFSTMHNNIHFCFTTLVTSALHPPLYAGPVFSSTAFSVAIENIYLRLTLYFVTDCDTRERIVTSYDGTQMDRDKKRAATEPSKGNHESGKLIKSTAVCSRARCCAWKSTSTAYSPIVTRGRLRGETDLHCRPRFNAALTREVFVLRECRN